MIRCGVCGVGVQSLSESQNSKLSRLHPKQQIQCLRATSTAGNWFSTSADWQCQKFLVGNGGGSSVKMP